MNNKYNLRKITYIIYVFIIMFSLLINVGCKTTNKMKKKSISEIMINLNSFYFTEDCSKLVVQADDYFFYCELNEEQMQFFKEIISQKEPIMPEVKEIYINNDGTFSTEIKKIIKNSNNNELSKKHSFPITSYACINVKGKVLKNISHPIEFKKIKNKYKVKIIISNEGKDSLNNIASKVSVIMKNTGEIIIEGVELSATILLWSFFNAPALLFS